MVDGRIARRELLRTGAAGITAAAAGCFGPEKDGVYAISLADGSERWMNNLGPVDAGPAVVDGTVFVGEGQTVHALATDDGTERWTYDVEFEYTNDIKDPALSNGTVLAPAGEELYALSATDGSERWTFAGDGETWLASRPADGVVVVGAGKTQLHGLAMEDGTERWTYEGDALDRNAATVVDSTVYVGSRSGRVVAIDATDGTERWTFGTDDAVRGDTAVHGGLVYASTTGNRVYALTTERGRERWRWDAPSGGPIMPLGASWPSIMALDRTVYVGYAGRLFALTANEGTEQWRATTDLTWMVLQHSNGTIYVSGDGLSNGAGQAGATSYAGLGAFDRRAGRERWSNVLGGDRTEDPPLVTAGAIYAGTDEGVVHALESGDGSEMWTFETGANEILGPVSDGDTVYVGTVR